MQDRCRFQEIFVDSAGHGVAVALKAIGGTSASGSL